MMTTRHAHYQGYRKNNVISVIIALAIVIFIVVLSVAMTNDNGESYDPKLTVYTEGSLYGNPALVTHNNVSGAMLTPVPYDSIWGPLVKQSEFQMGELTFGDCQEIGERSEGIPSVYTKPYPQLFCPAQ